MNINENYKNNVKMIGNKKQKKKTHKKKKKIPSSFIYRISHILAAMYLRPMNMVTTNVSLGSGLSSDVSHMQIIQVVYK